MIDQWHIEYQGGCIRDPDKSEPWNLLYTKPVGLEEAIRVLVTFRGMAWRTPEKGFYRAFRLHNPRTGEVIPEEAIQ